MPDESDDPELTPSEIPTLLGSSPSVADGTLAAHTPPPGFATPRTPGGTLQPGAVPLRLQNFGGFEVIAKLGQGGMGAVYRARQLSLDRMIALKVLPGDLQDDEHYVQRFQREATLAAQLNHPNVVRVFSFGEFEGSHYIAMELIEGENLRQRLKRGALEPLESLRICSDIARGLQHGWQTAHLIHRDIKPANILLSERGDVKVADLGLAKSLLTNTTGLTQTGTAMGTAHYMSPEQARGEKGLDVRADIYSLGCTLYEMLTGQPPYSGTDGITIIHQHLNAPLPAILKVLPGCPLPLARLVGKMLRKRPHERQQNYEELLDQIATVAAFIENGGVDTGAEARIAKWREVGGGASATPAPASPVPPRATTGSTAPAPRSKIALYGSLLAAVVALGAGAFFVLKPKGTTPPAVSRPGPASTANELKAAAPVRPQWQRIDFANGKDGETLHLQNNETRGGKLKVRNGAVRATIVADPSMRDVRVVTRMDRGQYHASVWGDRLGLFYQGPPTNQTLKIFRHPSLPPKAGEEFTIQLASIGNTHRFWLNGDLLGTVEDSTTSQTGSLAIQALDGRFKSMEVINLDGLPEAEALKLASVPAVAPAVLPQWERFDFSQLDEAALRELRVPMQGAYLHSSNYAGWTKPGQEAKNIAARCTVHFTDTTNDVRLSARQNGVENYPYVRLFRTGVELCIKEGSRDKLLTSAKLPTPLISGQDVDFQIAVIGTGMWAWVDGRLLGRTDTGNEARAGRSNIAAREGLIKSLDYLLLDGLPEAEALKLVSATGSVAANSGSAASAAPATATKGAPFVNGLGMKFVPVPITGGPTGGKRVLFSVRETRVQDWAAWREAIKRPNYKKVAFPQGPTHPVVSVGWDDVQEFCKWLTVCERTAGRLGPGEEYRLPSDHEWSCAVGIGDREDPAEMPEAKNKKITDVYPWGAAWPPPPGAGNFMGEETIAPASAGRFAAMRITGGSREFRDDFIETAPVGSFQPNILGLYDLAGNVSEWCDGWWNGEWSVRVSRGGAWTSFTKAHLFSTVRDKQSETTEAPWLGFRVVLAPVQ